MNQRTLAHLEFREVLSIFEGFARTPGGRRAFAHLQPALSRKEVEEVYRRCLTLNEIAAMMGPCPLEGTPDVEAILERLRVSGVVLEVEDLLDLALFIGKLGEVGRYFKSAEEKIRQAYEPVSDAWERVSSLRTLKAEIERAVDPTGYIRDGASPRLRGLRKKAERQKREIQNTLDRLIRSKRVADQLADQFFTVRNGRYVLPIKAGAKHSLQGIIHDQSQSRQTFFIEPMECVELNNALSMTYQEIGREEEAVKRSLTQHAAEALSCLWEGWRLLTRIDEIHARVWFMRTFDGSTVRLRERPGFRLKAARHPLLLDRKAAEVVPIDLVLPEGKQVLILSGVNAGGKTVALKTLGIDVLMVKAGLPLLASPESELYLYEEVFTEIGDEQSIADELSTFTAHVRHLKEMVAKSTENTLVLIDEIGAGTGMSEGAALALGILDVLEGKGATVMVTTHFEPLKGYGAQNPKALNVSVAFDAVNQRPLYVLHYGVPGNSNAFETAKRQGLGGEVLQAAERYRTRQDRLLTDLMADLEGLKREVLLEREKISEARREIQRLREQFYRLYEEISRKKAEMIRSWQIQWDRQIRKQRELFQRLMERAKGSVQKTGVFHATYSELKGELNRLAQPPFRREEDPSIPKESLSDEQVAVGDEVFVSTVGKPGRIAAVHPHQKTVEVVVKGMRLQVPVKKLRRWRTPEREERDATRSLVGVEVSSQAATELNVVGYRVQDALPEVDKFIDTARVHRLKEVTIIHGVGSGRLRKAIREFLSDHEGIKTLSDGDLRRGGHGITVVQLQP